ncbi:uncharacterized protein LOC115953577 isoform X2 [Quercus lobata]|uniref:uncharacterized protein LOC115953577 isoform X2 n=1 Tax=Quercus lobata TaxID=97700 RepID=UPI0012442BD3|nr:uncharacterized protein LOC115953577 isoform X2 [Quercus lobata]
MNRRIRASTKPLSSSSPTRSEPFHFHKYLKPGALAQIRDSRITAHRLNSLYLLSSSSSISIHRTSSPPSSNAAAQQTPVSAFTDGIPCFSGRIYGPRCPQRKKLVAAKSVLFLNPIPSSVQESPDSLNISCFSAWLSHLGAPPSVAFSFELVVVMLDSEITDCLWDFGVLSLKD